MSMYVRTVYGPISTHAKLRVVKIKRHLLRWLLFQSHTPPPLHHPSCHNCKNSTNTRTHSFIFTLTHTHNFSCSHLFSCSPPLSPFGARVPTLDCSLHVKRVCSCVHVCVFCCHGSSWVQTQKCPPLVLERENAIQASLSFAKLKIPAA